MQREHPGNRPRVLEFIRNMPDFGAADSPCGSTLEGARRSESVGPGQPTRTEFRPTEVSRDYAHGIEETGSVDLCEDGPSTRSSRLAVIVVAETTIGHSNGPQVVSGIMVATSLDVAHRQTVFEGVARFDNRQKP